MIGTKPCNGFPQMFMQYLLHRHPALTLLMWFDKQLASLPSKVARVAAFLCSQQAHQSPTRNTHTACTYVVALSFKDELVVVAGNPWRFRNSRIVSGNDARVHCKDYCLNITLKGSFSSKKVLPRRVCVWNNGGLYSSPSLAFYMACPENL